MEIRQVLRGNNTGFAPARPAGSGGKKTDGFVRPSADRLELFLHGPHPRLGQLQPVDRKSVV